MVQRFLFECLEILFHFLLLFLYICSDSKMLAVCIFRVPAAIRTVTSICDKIMFCFKSSTDCYYNINIYKRCFYWMAILDETDYISCAMHAQKIDARCGKEMPLQFINILSIILCRFMCSQINSHSLIWNNELKCWNVYLILKDLIWCNITNRGSSSFSTVLANVVPTLTLS